MSEYLSDDPFCSVSYHVAINMNMYTFVNILLHI